MPFVEGYGMTEVSGASTISILEDPVSGQVGGPLDCLKLRLKDVPDMNYLTSD